jgi:hypothetical protein
MKRGETLPVSAIHNGVKVVFGVDAAKMGGSEAVAAKQTDTPLYCRTWMKVRTQQDKAASDLSQMVMNNKTVAAQSLAAATDIAVDPGAVEKHVIDPTVAALQLLSFYVN